MRFGLGPVFGILICYSSVIYSEQWRLPDGRTVITSAGSTPPVIGAKRIDLSNQEQPSREQQAQERAKQDQLRREQQAQERAKQDQLRREQQAQERAKQDQLRKEQQAQQRAQQELRKEQQVPLIRTSSVPQIPYTTEYLPDNVYAGDCVLYARSKVPTLPHNLWTWKDKLAIVNSHTPSVGSAAMIPYVDAKTKEAVGHVAYVEKVEGNSITLVDANFKTGKITRRTATGTSLKDAENILKIAGYFRP